MESCSIATDIFAIETDDGKIEIWNWKTRTRERSFQAHKKEIFRLTVFGENRIALGGDDAEIHLWNTLTGEKLQSQLEHEVGSVVYVERENAIYSGGGDGWLHRWNLADDPVSIFQETEEVSYLAYDSRRDVLFEGRASRFVA